MPNPPPTWRFLSYLVDNEDFRFMMLGWNMPPLIVHTLPILTSFESQVKLSCGEKWSPIPLSLKSIQDSNTNRQAKLCLAHETLTETRILANIKAWQLAKRNFDLWVEQLEAAKLSYTTLHFHKFGNKVGRLLVKLWSGPR